MTTKRKMALAAHVRGFTSAMPLEQRTLLGGVVVVVTVLTLEVLVSVTVGSDAFDTAQESSLNDSVAPNVTMARSTLPVTFKSKRQASSVPQTASADGLADSIRFSVNSGTNAGK